MGVLYCDPSDLYRYGLPRGMLGASARLVQSALAATDAIELDGHGFVDGDQVAFRAAEGGALPAPLVEGTTYYALRVSDSLFKVAATSGGPVINLTTDGVSVLAIATLSIADVIEFRSRWVDDVLPAHVVPLTTPVPVLVRGVVAKLAARDALQLAGHVSDSVNEAEAEAMTLLQRWSKGVPLRDAAATGPANKAVTSTLVTVGGVDPRGWGSGVLP